MRSVRSVRKVFAFVLVMVALLAVSLVAQVAKEMGPGIQASAPSVDAKIGRAHV